VKVTVIGGNGFIGKNIVNKLLYMGLEVQCPVHNDEEVFTKALGTVFYCAGVTSDYRKRSFDTVNAHVSYFSDIVKYANYDSILYLSSTRVYIASQTGLETSKLSVNPNDPEDLFNISKLMGESICLANNNNNIKVARLSNVYGNDFKSNNFLFSIIKDAVRKGEIILETTLNSQKDYISVMDVVDILIKIAFQGKQKIYNVASGVNITNREIIDIIQDVTGCNVKIVAKPRKIQFPLIDISAMQHEFGNIELRNLKGELPQIILDYKNLLK
jgi:nucleoside-diphosphate-sugar epimerase